MQIHFTTNFIDYFNDLDYNIIMKNLLKREIKSAIEEDNAIKLKELISDKSLCNLYRLFQFFLDCCVRGKINCVKVFFDDPDIDIFQERYSAFASSISFNQYKVCKLFLEHPDFNPNVDFSKRFFLNTCREGKHQILNELIKHDNFKFKHFYEEGFLEACGAGSIKILEVFVNNGLVEKDFDFKKILTQICLYKRSKTLKYVLNLNFISFSELNYNNNEALISSVKSKSSLIFNRLFKEESVRNSFCEDKCIENVFFNLCSMKEKDIDKFLKNILLHENTKLALFSYISNSNIPDRMKQFDSFKYIH